MKQIVLILINIFYLNSISDAQVIEGTIRDKDNKSPLPYANIGILGKERGTVSDESGHFKLKMSDSSKGDSVKVSYIGYESIVIYDFATDTVGIRIIELEPINVQLQEVKIYPKKYKEVIIGNTVKWNKIIFSFLSAQLGSEIGTYIKLRKRAMIEELRFNIVKNQYDSLVFRVNIYNFSNDLPQNNILKEQIIIRPENKVGLVVVDLSKYNIWLENDFVVSLEYLKVLGSVEKKVFISTGIMNSSSFGRLGSQGEWHRFKYKGFDLGIGLHVKMKKEI